MGVDAVGWSNGRAVLVEVHTVSKPVCFPGDGLLPNNCKGRCRNSETQHGTHTSACVSQYHYLVAIHKTFPCNAFR